MVIGHKYQSLYGDTATLRGDMFRNQAVVLECIDRLWTLSQGWSFDLTNKGCI